jgi:2-oxoglutarate dehydrogenase complex dehydrogenase (E1) component-like enzyme
MWPTGSKPADGAPLSKLFDNTAFAGKWSSFRQPTSIEETLTSPETGLPVDRLRAVAKTSVTVPSDIKVHPRIERAHIEDRAAQIDSTGGPCSCLMVVD